MSSIVELLAHLTPWKQKVAISVADFIHSCGIQKGSIAVFKLALTLSDADTVESTLVKLRQEGSTDTKAEMQIAMYEAVISSNIHPNEVSEFVTNLLMDLQKELQKQEYDSTSVKIPVSTSANSTPRKTKARIYTEGVHLKPSEVICAECNVVVLKKSLKRHKIKMHPKSEVQEVEEVHEDQQNDAFDVELEAFDEVYKKRRKRRHKILSTASSTPLSSDGSDDDYEDSISSTTRSSLNSVNQSPKRRMVLEIPSCDIPTVVQSNLGDYLQRKGSHSSSTDRKLILLTLKRFVFKIIPSGDPSKIMNILDQEIISTSCLNGFIDTFIKQQAQSKTILNNIRNLQIILDWRISASSGSIGDESWLRRSRNAEEHLKNLARNWKKKSTSESKKRDQDFYIAQESWISWKILLQAAAQAQIKILEMQEISSPTKRQAQVFQELAIITFVIKCRPQRPAVYNTLKISDWTSRSSSTFILKNFKTSSTYGNLCITLDPDVESNLEIFINVFRPSLVNDAKLDNIFLADVGSTVTDGLFKLTGVKTSITRIRQIYRTEAALLLSQEDAGILDEADGHSPETVSIYYNKLDRKKITERADSIFFKMNQSLISTSVETKSL
jgi:predicted transcriptional regulator YheO